MIADIQVCLFFLSVILCAILRWLCLLLHLMIIQKTRNTEKEINVFKVPAVRKKPEEIAVPKKEVVPLPKGTSSSLSL